MTVHSNGSTLAVSYKETFPVYKQGVCFSKDAITNIIYIKNFILKYIVTYDSIDQICVMHREDQEKSNI